MSFMHCICGYWSCPQTYNTSFYFFEILQGIGQYIPHKVKELLVYAHGCCLFMHTQSLRELWEDTGDESESNAHVMAQTPLIGRTQASQLIINSIFFFILTTAEMGVVKNKSKETLSGSQILVGKSGHSQIAHPNN